MTKATFQPAIFSTAKTYHLEDGILSQIVDGAPEWKFALADVDQAAFVNYAFKKTRATRLDLYVGDTCRSMRLGQPATDWLSNPDTRQFLTLTRDICLGLEAAQPGLEITQGEYGRARWVMFIIGILTLVIAIAIIALAVLTGAPSDKLWVGMLPMGLMFLIGAYYTYFSRPWRLLDSLSAADFAQKFDSWLNPNGPPV